jgi:hypothetical protein
MIPSFIRVAKYFFEHTFAFLENGCMNEKNRRQKIVSFAAVLPQTYSLIIPCLPHDWQAVSTTDRAHASPISAL